MNLFVCKKGALGEDVMSFSWLFLIFFVTVGIVGGVVMFFGSDVDVRGIESAQLVATVRTCIMDHRLNVEATLSLEQLATMCNIDAGVVEDVFVFALYKNELQILNVGDTVSCDFKGAEKNMYYPRCREERFVFEGATYTIRAGSHQITRREAA